MAINPVISEAATTASDGRGVSAGRVPVRRVDSALSPAAGLQVRVVSTREELEPYVPRWEDLAGASIEPNPFYEPWMLLPAIQYLGKGEDLRFVLVEADVPGQQPGGRGLIGFFPLCRRRRFRGLPLDYWTLWQHSYCYLCAPLVRRGFESKCLHAFLDWCAIRSAGAAVLEWRLLPGDGPLDVVVNDVFRERATVHYTMERYHRALLRVECDADVYLKAVLSSKKRRSLRSCYNQLAAHGRVEFDSLGTEGSTDAWIEEFLTLEAGSWKGKAGSAFKGHKADQMFFREMVKTGAIHRRVRMAALRLDDCAIAMTVDLLSGHGAFGFKTAYDESFAAQSPGVQLLVENTRRWMGPWQVSWVDSCTEPGHPLVDTIWIYRRAIQTILVSNGRLRAGLLVASYPLLRWLSHKCPRMGGYASADRHSVLPSSPYGDHTTQGLEPSWNRATTS